MSNERISEITEWYQQHSDAIFRYILLMVRNHQQAEDLTQETFINAFKYYDTFERKANPKTWLFRIAHNLTVDFIRKQKPLELLKELVLLGKNTSTLPEEMVEVRENSTELYHALGQLKVPYREVIILRKIREFSIEETGEILNWSQSKVKNTLSRAIAALEKQLNKEGIIHEKN
ncbi:RNA polymerase sigma factor [Planococcus sp. N028]|uniref:RNA polymerase sigma factor n=1 Tax=Planococcus shixiaomingii TaxID=3058393 RepID=A0ABT8MYF5_9BACL|nr:MULTISPECIES: RNA polymerase sigma factor [unclassified Planococcus (in: firmicutes)]MDN7240633.1 RNA polymerase sigma factor [Planococcus sp. N028]WKA56519.1 RNA polymerase sigma factor [Planococcus sp. N022]